MAIEHQVPVFIERQKKMAQRMGRRPFFRLSIRREKATVAGANKGVVLADLYQTTQVRAHGVDGVVSLQIPPDVGLGLGDIFQGAYSIVRSLAQGENRRAFIGGLIRQKTAI